MKVYDSLDQFLSQNKSTKILLYNNDILDLEGFQHPGPSQLIDDNIGEDIQLKFDQQGHSEAAYDMLLHYKVAEIKQIDNTKLENDNDHHQNRLMASKYINSKREIEIHKKIDQKIDLKKPLLDQVKKLSLEEFKFFVKRPRFLDNYDEFQVHSNYWWDIFKSRLTRSLYINMTVLGILSIIFMYMSRQKLVMKVVLFMIGMFIIWPLLEYYFHRLELHKEINLKEDSSGESYAELFKTHLCHHVYMKSKYRVSLGLDFMLLATVVVIWIVYNMGWIDMFLPIECGILQGGVIYDWIHYSFHHYEVRFGIGVLDRHYQKMRQMHMVHHYRNNETNYGVSTWWIDWLFNTYDYDDSKKLA